MIKSNPHIRALLFTPLILLALRPAADQSASPPAWKIVEEIYQAEHALPAAPAAPAAQVQQPVPEKRSYVFESYKDIEANDLLGGVDFVLQKYSQPVDTEALVLYNRDINHKLLLLFEHYPLAARSRQDFDALQNLIFSPSTKPALRIFLLRHSAPGLEPKSAFGFYMQGHMSIDAETFQKRLSDLIQLPQESPRVQIAAMDTYVAQVAADFEALLSQDPAATAHAAAGNVVHVRELITQPNSIPLNRRTQVLLQRKSEALGAWAETLKATADNGQRKQDVRDKAKETLDRILLDFPIPNRAALNP